MQEEIWADIEGSSFKISNFGKLINKHNKIKKLYLDKSRGYLQVNITINRVKKSHRIHKLVAITFIPNPLNLPQVNHKDGNKLNNNVLNLEWVSHRDNILHSKKGKNFTSELSGVYKRNNKWIASVNYNKTHIHIGTFTSEINAHNAYKDFLSKNGENIIY